MTLLTLLSGTTAYEFQRLNASHGAAPSLDTIRRRIKDIVGEPLRGCGFSNARFCGARDHFHSLGYTADVFLLVNDATALLPALGYNPTTDEVVGFAVSDEELPGLDTRAGTSLQAFLERFKDKKLATQVEIYLLVPLAPRVPPYILAAFGQSGSQSADTVQHRLAIARTEMEKRGALILGWAADGASAHYKLMRQLRSLVPGAQSFDISNVPALRSNATTVRLPARVASFLNTELLIPDTPIFDPVHLLNLLRNAPMRKNAAMAVGSHHINLLGLRERIVAKLGAAGLEARLGVRYSDWEVTDRMNYAAAQRLFSTKLLSYAEAEFGNDHRGVIPAICCNND